MSRIYHIVFFYQLYKLMFIYSSPENSQYEKIATALLRADPTFMECVGWGQLRPFGFPLKCRMGWICVDTLGPSPCYCGLPCNVPTNQPRYVVSSQNKIVTVLEATVPKSIYEIEPKVGCPNTKTCSL